MKNKRIVFIVEMILLFIITATLSYGYFEIMVSGNDSTKDIIVNSGSLKLTYTEGLEIDIQNIEPGWSTTKEISVKNNGTLETAYNIVWQELTNEIINNELVISATCQRLNSTGTIEGVCDSIPQTPISDMTIARKILIESGYTHKYTFTILFKEINVNQNYNMKKSFDGKLGIEEYKKSSFADDSWETIITNLRNGYIDEYSLGDTKEIDLGSYGKHILRIANMSTPSECETKGFSQSACGFVLEFADIITEHNMNPSGEYKGTTYQYGWNKDGWPVSEMYTFVNNDIYNLLPSNLKNIIIDTMVVSGHGKNDTKNFVSTDKLYLLAPKEIFSNFSVSFDTAKDLTRTLDYYMNLGVTTSNKNAAIKKNETSASYWWLRTSYSNNYYGFYSIYSNGNVNWYYAHRTIGVSPAFRIG